MQKVVEEERMAHPLVVALEAWLLVELVILSMMVEMDMVQMTNVVEEVLLD